MNTLAATSKSADLVSLSERSSAPGSALKLGGFGFEFAQGHIKFLQHAARNLFPEPLDWATPNRIELNLKTMLLRDFSDPDAPADATPVLIDAPYAGHPSTIADYANGQSLVQTLKAAGVRRIYLTDWKSATWSMRNFEVDTYLSDLNVVVDHLGGKAHLVGLCQGGWMSAMFAARFPGKAASLVIAGAPIDTQAGTGPLKRLVNRMPMRVYEHMVLMGGGRMLGRYMLNGWKSMHPAQHYFLKYVQLYRNLNNEDYLSNTQHFARWYETTVDLPGRFYLQVVKNLFKKNLFAKGEFVALGRRLDLKSITVPVYLLAGATDDITTYEQVFATEYLLGTPRDRIVKELAPGGHIGLFMGRQTLAQAWPKIGSWLKANDPAI